MTTNDCCLDPLLSQSPWDEGLRGTSAPLLYHSMEPYPYLSTPRLVPPYSCGLQLVTALVSTNWSGDERLVWLGTGPARCRSFVRDLFRLRDV